MAFSSSVVVFQVSSVTIRRQGESRPVISLPGSHYGGNWIPKWITRILLSRIIAFFGVSPFFLALPFLFVGVVPDEVNNQDVERQVMNVLGSC